MDATIADPLVGRLLDGRYRVESRIARGGMATVYVATDTRLDRTVALKIMHGELATDDDFVRRFIGEAKSVARLSHPNVVAVFDQGREGENLYLAMEYVPGRTLRDLLNERGRLAPAEALDLLVPVLAGLGAAHQAGLVHRDVKPENVLLAADGRVKVVDFGLARTVAEARHTKTGMLLGTVAYLAPEQVSHATADARSDVYAAGVMLFELVTGRQPYTADTPLAVAYRHVNDVVPAPSAVTPGVPQAVDDLVVLATNRDPGRRPADASQLLRAVFDARPRLPGGSAFASPGVPLPGQQQWPGQHDVPSPHGTPAPYGGPPYGGPPQGAAGPLNGPAPQGVPGPLGAPPPHPAPAQAPPSLPVQRSTIPGVPGVPGVPALPAFGAGNSGGAAAGTDRPGAPPTALLGQPGRQHHTLVVSRDVGGHPPARRGLADWLFSRRAAYVAAGLVVALIMALLAWWQTSGRYTQVPNVTGLSPATATTELRNLGFTVKMGAPQADNQVPQGAVARTVPATGSHAPNGSTITVIPSAGPRMIQVPNVTGKPLADAQNALAAVGLTPGPVHQEASDTVPKGEVISTDPTAGTSWPQTKTVALTVSAGIGLPDFTGQPKQVAEQWLQQHQLQVQEHPVSSASQPQDSVVRQSPAADTPVSPGEVVTLDISTGPPMVHIPDVTGMPVPKARERLRGLGFQVNVVGFGDGRVIAFSPTGQAAKGSTITLIAGPGGLP